MKKFMDEDFLLENDMQQNKIKIEVEKLKLKLTLEDVFLNLKVLS